MTASVLKIRSKKKKEDKSAFFSTFIVYVSFLNKIFFLFVGLFLFFVGLFCHFFAAFSSPFVIIIVIVIFTFAFCL